MASPDPEIVALADAPKSKASTLDPEIQAAGTDTSLPDSYRESSKANPDHVAQAQEISKRRGIDPNYTLANIDDVKKQDAMPDFDSLKRTNPWSYNLAKRPDFMGVAHDDFIDLVGMENHAKTARIASSMLDAGLAGWQDSVRGRELASGSPDVILGPDASVLNESIAQGVGMAADLPEFMVFGAAGGALGGPVSASMAAFGGHAALKQALEERDHGSIDSAAELLLRAKAIALPAAKGATTGLALAVTGGAAAAYGASPAAKLAFEIGAMATTGAAIEGRMVKGRDFISNAIAFLGAHAASMSWDMMGKAAESSKTRGRGQIGAKIVADHADNVSGPVAIHVSAWDKIHGFDVENINKKLGIEKEYESAKARNGDLDIPAGKWTSAEMDPHRKNLLDDIKEPGKKSINQIKEEAEQKKIDAEKQAEAEEAAPKISYTKYPGLSERQRVAETNLAEILSKPDAAEKYAALPGTEGGKIIDVDEFRNLSPEYSQDNASRMAYTLATHEPASAAAKKMFVDKLAEPATGPVLFMAGGGGSGKSTVRKGIPTIKEISDAADIIMDGTFSKKERAIRDIDAALDSGRSVTIAYVHRAFESASKGVSDRSKETGRWVPPEVLAESHVGAQETFKAIAEHYRDDPRVTLKAFENPDAAVGEHVSPKALDLDTFHSLSYTNEGEPSAKTVERLAAVAKEDNGPIESLAAQEGSQPGDGQEASGHERGAGQGDAAGLPDSRRRRFAEGLRSLSHDESVLYDARGSGAVDQGLGRLEGSKQFFTPSKELKALLDASKLPAVDLYELEQTPENSQRFSEAISSSKNASKFGAAVYVYPDEAYREMRTFTTADGKSGFAIKPDGDIVSVFSDGGGKVHSMLALAVEQGGRKLDCFDTQLPTLYEANGFREVRREPWNEEYKPAGWSKEQFAKFNKGEPDIVYMEYDPNKPLRSLEEMTPLQEREQATSDAIAAAQQESGQTSRPIKGLDPKLQAELTKMEDSARKEAESILLKPQLAEIKRENRAILEAERERATAEIGNQVGNEPVFRAFALFNPEGAEHDFSQKTIWKKSADYMNNRLSAEDVEHFETVAEMSGFTSADEMARQLLLTERGPAFQAEVKRRLDQHMTQFADLKDSEAMKTEAMRAVHNEKSGELLALQYQVMEGMAQNADINATTNKARAEYRAAMWETAKKIARDTINAKPVETAGRYHAYYTEEINSAKRAVKAEAEGKWQEAGAARLEQLHSHALVAESMRARTDIERWHRSIEKQRMSDPMSWKDQDHFFQAAALLNRFGFERRDYEPSKRTESLQAWAARMEDKTNTVELADWLQDESISKNWKKLTPPELKDVRNALKNIKHVSNFEDKAYVVFDKADLGDVEKSLVSEQQANANNGKGAPLSLHQDWRDKIVAQKDAAMFQLIAPETWLRKLDGYKNFGSWWRAFYEQYARGADEKAKMLVEHAEEYSRIWDAYTPKEKEAMGKKVFVPELNDSLMKSEIMTMALNYGSESNKERLLEGRNWTDAQVKNILDREMTKRDWDTVQATWKQVNSLWPKIAELYRELTGFTPDKIEAKKFMTPHGEYEGGYFPLRSDPRVEVRGAMDQDVTASLSDSPPAWRASTKNGFSKGRVEGAQYKVSLDINGIQRHMTDVIHDLTMRKWVMDANRLLARKGVQNSVADAIGMDGYRMLNDWVKAVAGTNDVQSREFLGDFFHSLRRRTIIANLGLRISSAILQVDDLSAYGRVDPDNFGVINAATSVTGFYGEVVRSPAKFNEGVDFVYERSKYMKYERGENIDRDIKDAARREWGHDDTMGKVSMSMVSTIDKLLSIPVWKEAYKKGLDMHDGNEQKAVDFADNIIRRAQASGRIGELPAIMRGSEKQKALTMFYSFVNKRLNLWYEAIDRTKTAADLPRLAGTAMALWIVPTMFSSFVHNGVPNTKEKKKKYMKDLLVYPTSLFPVIRDVADMSMDKIMGLKSFGYSPTPMTRSVDMLGNMLGTLAKGKKAKTQDKAESVAKVAAYAAPYPDAANNVIFNMADMLTHGMTPRFNDLMQRRRRRERHQ